MYCHATPIHAHIHAVNTWFPLPITATTFYFFSSLLSADLAALAWIVVSRLSSRCDMSSTIVILPTPGQQEREIWGFLSDNNGDNNNNNNDSNKKGTPPPTLLGDLMFQSRKKQKQKQRGKFCYKTHSC